MQLQKGRDNLGRLSIIKKTPVFSFKKDSMRKGREVNWEVEEEEEECRDGTGKAGGRAWSYFTLMGLDFREHLF